ncbi:hypothetical protein OV090_18405 [Nannocystis sp. RBIL2]|uniref:protein kinase domain-containing protein n=1 Tax=Nannocystis sp. RBIL2 TaxID=2996788 RepID=UPI00226E97B1|nr:hypothetical protein [Nannocystis sp. RBIL2]MCY1066753.1 hypothetical protein [Nannocystis sp. RBIL2]
MNVQRSRGASTSSRSAAACSVQRWALGVSAGVVAALGTGVLHRDIKPANCMVSPEGHVKLIDLGAIKPLDLKLRATTAGSSSARTHTWPPRAPATILRRTDV